MENNKNLDEVKKGDFSIADIETIRLTSKSYIVKSQIKPKFWSKSLITTIILILIFYITLLLIYPFISQIKEMMVREMSEQNGNLGLNQNYSRVKPNDKKYIYIPIVGTDDIHGNFFPKVNHIKVGDEELIYKTGGLEFVARYINILREEFGANRVLYFDGGDFYQGGMASVLFDGEIMQVHTSQGVGLVAKGYLQAFQCANIHVGETCKLEAICLADDNVVEGRQLKAFHSVVCHIAEGRELETVGIFGDVGQGRHLQALH